MAVMAMVHTAIRLGATECILGVWAEESCRVVTEWENLAPTLGAGVRYTNSKKTFSIGLNVEGVWYDNKTPSYFKQYDYPVPKAPEKD